MIEYFITGSSREGKTFPREHGMSLFCIQSIVDSYVKKHVGCIHVSINVALPDNGIYEQLKEEQS